MKNSVEFRGKMSQREPLKISFLTITFYKKSFVPKCPYTELFRDIRDFRDKLGQMIF
jgi:hypothetical protein